MLLPQTPPPITHVFLTFLISELCPNVLPQTIHIRFGCMVPWYPYAPPVLYTDRCITDSGPQIQHTLLT